MTKVKMSKEESNAADFIQRRRAALERWVSWNFLYRVLLVNIVNVGNVGKAFVVSTCSEDVCVFQVLEQNSHPSRLAGWSWFSGIFGEGRGPAQSYKYISSERGRGDATLPQSGRCSGEDFFQNGWIRWGRPLSANHIPASSFSLSILHQTSWYFSFFVYTSYYHWKQISQFKNWMSLYKYVVKSESLGIWMTYIILS